MKTRQGRKTEEWKNCGNPTRGKNGRMEKWKNFVTFVPAEKLGKMSSAGKSDRLAD